MALDVLTDDAFTLPDETGAPRCRYCKSPLFVEITERDERGLPIPGGFAVSCPEEDAKPDQHAQWDYDDVLTAVGQVGHWCEKEVKNRRNWELALWGESDVPDLEVA